MIKWRQFYCQKTNLRLDITLKCGQSFRWKRFYPQSFSCETPVYIGVLRDRLLLLSQDDSNIFYHCPNIPDDKGIEEDLKDYFQLSVNLPALYSEWAKNDSIFEKISQDYPGVRMLRQDPLENVFSFICSANNNIARISGMVEKMCVEYGKLVAEFEEVKYYMFPSLEQLHKPEVEARLRELGFGYRAKYIQQSAASILDKGGLSWLYSHRCMSYSEARQSLLQLQGVGPKVADCVLLMSMDQTGAVPVDTHMFNIAKQYLPHLSQVKTVTDKVYLEIGNHFRSLYGDYAGWAHSVLFSADLKHLKDNKTIKIEKDLKEIKESKVESLQKPCQTKAEKLLVEEIKTEKSDPAAILDKKGITDFFKTVKPKSTKRKNIDTSDTITPLKVEKF